MNRYWKVVSLFGLLTSACFAQAPVPAQSYLRNNSFVNWESPHVHPLDITPDGSKLLAVNTANNNLEIYSTAGSSLSLYKTVPVGLDPVTVRTRTNSEAWVVNVISDSVSIVDLQNGIVTKTLQANDEPADVVFAGTSQNLALVSCAQAKTLLVFNANSPTTPTATIPINGEQPRALAVDKTGRFVYLAIFESGNGTTAVVGGVANGFENDLVRNPNGPYSGIAVPPNNGKVFNPPINPALPAAPPVSLIVRRTLVGGIIQWLDDNLKDWSKFISGAPAVPAGPGNRVEGWDMPDRDVAIVDTTNNSVTYQSGLMNILMAIGVNPSTNEVTVVGTDASNQIRYEPVVQSTFTRVNFARFTPGGTNAISDLNPQLNYALKTIPAAQRQSSLGDPRSMVWSADGTQGYVTGMGSNNVAIVGPKGQRLGLINVGQGPTGLVLSSGVAYVLNKFDATISTINLSSNSVTATTPLYFDPTPASIKAGRPLLYNTQKNSGLGQISCASCHVDARWDRLAWDLGVPGGSMVTNPGTTNTGNPVTFHPMKGPFLTMTLVDTMQAPSFHWRGDRPVLEDFGPAFQTLMGADNPASETDINNLRNFLSTISLPPNPNRNLDNSYSNSVPLAGPNNSISAFGNANNGAAEFETNCRSCHPGHTNRGAAFIDNAQDFGFGIRNPPTWKNFYKRQGLWFQDAQASNSGFGFQQDGTFDSTQNGSRDNDMMAFMMSFNGGYPYEPAGLNSTNWSNFSHAAVGKQVTLSPANPTDTTGLLTQLEALGDTGAIGLVAKGGVVTGQARRGWMYLGSGVWQSDRLTEVDSTGVMNALVAGGATITFTAVPNESAARIGIDMDGDGILDADDPQPNLASLSPANLALAGTATSATVLDDNHTAAQAIDGNTLGYYDQNSMLHTQGNANDWFQEDLGTNSQISLVQLFNRWDCCASRLANVSVFISQVPFTSTDVNQTRAQLGVKEFFLSGVQGMLAQIPMQTPGRYIRVQLNNTTDPLQLAEVRIMGYPIASFVNPGAETVAAGTSVNLPLTLQGSNAGLAYNYTASNLPPGLSVNPSTGAITGTISSIASPSYTTTVTASSAAGAPSVSFVWNITPVPVSFVLTSTPTAVTIAPGGSASASIGVSSISGFTGAITLAASSLPAGVTAGFAAGSGANATATFTAASNTALGTTNTVITATAGTYSETITLPVTVSATADFAIASLLPSSVSLQPGSIATSKLILTPLGGFSASPELSINGLPVGVTFTYTGSLAAGYNLSLASTSATALGTYPLTIAATSGSFFHSAAMLLTITATAGVTAVDLSKAYNVYAIFNDGSPVTNGGFDTVGYAYSSHLTGNSLTWNNLPFYIGPGGSPTAVSSTTVNLPGGTFSSLNFLAASSLGLHTSQPFTVTYTDGTTVTTTQSLSDWGAPQSVPGESIASMEPYRLTTTGADQAGPWYVYGYTIPLDTSKVTSSITFPANANVAIFAMTLQLAASVATNQTQTINFAPIATQAIGNSLVLAASATSRLPVAFTLAQSGACTLSGSTLNFAAAGTCTVTASQAGNATYLAAPPITQSFSVTAQVLSGPTVMNLAAYFNVYGIATTGTAPNNGGLDGGGYAYSASTLGTSVTYAGISFPLGPANAPDAVYAATIKVPANNFSTLYIVGTAVDGPPPSQVFTVTYSDGSTSTFTQQVSDWGLPANYPGETIVKTTTNRVTPNGEIQNLAINLYGYTFPLTAGKVPIAATLPNTPNIVVLGIGWQ